mmetsp:Transcript_35623/g.101500  ORF Transcript_35623/g.101500 Transcript_35623/m.101500 type:complete len:261 (-) Transcript_35623:23-805(-)
MHPRRRLARVDVARPSLQICAAVCRRMAGGPGLRDERAAPAGLLRELRGLVRVVVGAVGMCERALVLEVVGVPKYAVLLGRRAHTRNDLRLVAVRQLLGHCIVLVGLQREPRLDGVRSVHFVDVADGLGPALVVAAGMLGAVGGQDIQQHALHPLGDLALGPPHLRHRPRPRLGVGARRRCRRAFGATVAAAGPGEQLRHGVVVASVCNRRRCCLRMMASELLERLRQQLTPILPDAPTAACSQSARMTALGHLCAAGGD